MLGKALRSVFLQDCSLGKKVGVVVADLVGESLSGTFVVERQQRSH
jgi:hypothetical protein